MSNPQDLKQALIKALVKKMVEAFEPYRNGFTFMPFLDLFRE
jgi:hypothetical protein